MVDQATKKRVTQIHMDALENDSGPVYGVSLIASLPIIGGSMRQAMPSRSDLEQVRKVSERTAAGYEVLLAHYREQCEKMEKLEQSWQDGHAAQEARHRDELEQLQQQIVQLEATVRAGNTAISQLEQAVAHKGDCAKCRGTGQEYRSWNNDYIDCSACDGKGR